MDWDAGTRDLHFQLDDIEHDGVVTVHFNGLCRTCSPKAAT